jgi:hypothetical protein
MDEDATQMDRTALSDNETPELATVVGRLSQLPMAERKMTVKGLSETIAVVKAEASHKVVVIDDQGGATALVVGETPPGPHPCSRKAGRIDHFRASIHCTGFVTPGRISATIRACL